MHPAFYLALMPLAAQLATSAPVLNGRSSLGIVPHKAYTIYPESSKAKREDADESYSHPPPSKEKREDADESYAIHPPSTKARREDADEAYYIPPADGMPAF